MHKLVLILICMCAVPSFAQTSTPKYQSGTIMAVANHQNAPGEAASAVPGYDVSVKIGNVLYVILFAPRNGVSSVEYSPGIDMLFLVGKDTLTFNSKLSGTTEAPILRREVLSAQSTLDWSKARSQYFSMKQQHLSEALDLTDDQQSKTKPALERETAEAGEILWNPVLSQKNKLRRYEKLISSSDARMKPFLSQNQVGKLMELRRQQKDEVKRLILEQTTAKED